MLSTLRSSAPNCFKISIFLTIDSPVVYTKVGQAQILSLRDGKKHLSHRLHSVPTHLHFVKTEIEHLEESNIEPSMVRLILVCHVYVSHVAFRISVP